MKFYLVENGNYFYIYPFSNDLSLHRNSDIFISLIISFLCHQVLFGYFLYIREGAWYFLSLLQTNLQ